ncbi:MAG: ZIP family metal transporter, partial [archaeon]
MFIELFASLLAISLISFVGLFTIRLSPKQIGKYLEFMVAFAIGALLGDVFIHLLPELAEKSFSIDLSLTVLAGIVTFFVLEKVVHWHHCHHLSHGKNCTSFTSMSLMGDVLHNFIDGVILAGAFLVNPVVG